MSRHVSPSILAADFNNLERDIKKINSTNASWIHCDVMDGVFVPNISFGMPVIEAVAKVATKPLDVHLMIVEPERYIDKFCSIGIDFLTIHQEACKDLHQGVSKIKENGVKAGVTISPQTPVSVLSEIVPEVDLILIMSVHPGFGGQSFIEDSYQKIRDLKEMILKANSKALIQVDGGVNLQNARQLYDSGVDILVAGTTVFASPDPGATVDQILAI